jgi:hypothetical protein
MLAKTQAEMLAKTLCWSQGSLKVVPGETYFRIANSWVKYFLDYVKVAQAPF